MGREVRAAGVVLWASLLVVALAIPATLAVASTTERGAQLTKYCASARPFLRYDAVDPALLSAGARYTPPRLSVAMGRKLDAVSQRIAKQGTIVLGAVVNSVGRVAHGAVVEPSAHAALDREAIGLLKDADFVPATVDGTAVRSCTIVRFVFKVVDGAQTERRQPMTFDQWLQLEESQQRALIQEWPLPDGPPPDEPPWQDIEADFRRAYPRLDVRGFGNVHGSTMLVVMRPFIFDKRGRPSWHLGVPIRYALTEDVPTGFEVNRKYVWAPENYLNFVDQHADQIRAALGNPQLGREEMLDALVGMPFDDWIDQCRKHPHNTSLVRGQRVLGTGHR